MKQFTTLHLPGNTVAEIFKSLLMNDRSGTTAQSSPQWSYDVRLEKPNSKTKRPPKYN
jgi:hypothetical protein